MQVTAEHGRSALVFQTSILAMSRAASTATPVANGTSYPVMPVDLAPGTHLIFAGSTESLHQIQMGFSF
jgi:hypothetical protein